MAEGIATGLTIEIRHNGKIDLLLCDDEGEIINRQVISLNCLDWLPWIAFAAILRIKCGEETGNAFVNFLAVAEEFISRKDSERN